MNDNQNMISVTTITIALAIIVTAGLFTLHHLQSNQLITTPASSTSSVSTSPLDANLEKQEEYEAALRRARKEEARRARRQHREDVRKIREIQHQMVERMQRQRSAALGPISRFSDAQIAKAKVTPRSVSITQRVKTRFVDHGELSENEKLLPCLLEMEQEEKRAEAQIRVNKRHLAAHPEAAARAKMLMLRMPSKDRAPLMDKSESVALAIVVETTRPRRPNLTDRVSSSFKSLVTISGHSKLSSSLPTLARRATIGGKKHGESSSRPGPTRS